MYVARFSYNIKPIDQEQAPALLNREVIGARKQGIEARFLVPLPSTPCIRPPGRGLL
ncbi:MAG: hypothetical protein ACJ789_02525 [Thermomicrobiales bacterium]